MPIASRPRLDVGSQSASRSPLAGSTGLAYYCHEQHRGFEPCLLAGSDAELVLDFTVEGDELLRRLLRQVFPKKSFGKRSHLLFHIASVPGTRSKVSSSECTYSAACQAVRAVEKWTAPARFGAHILSAKFSTKLLQVDRESEILPPELFLLSPCVPKYAPAQADLKSLEQDLQLAARPFAARVDQCLLQLEGATLECDRAKEEIERIRRIVAMSGRRLVFEGRPVTIHVDTHGRRKTAGIHLVTVGLRPQEVLYSQSAFPLLATEPTD